MCRRSGHTVLIIPDLCSIETLRNYIDTVIKSDGGGSGGSGGGSTTTMTDDGGGSDSCTSGCWEEQ
jgi:hypothetical protein